MGAVSARQIPENYELEFRVIHADPNSKVHAEIDGTNVTGSLTVPDTNSHNTFASVKKPVALTAGKHVLRFAWDANASNGYAASFDWIKISQITNPQPPPPPPPPPGPGGTIASNTARTSGMARTRARTSARRTT